MRLLTTPAAAAKHAASRPAAPIKSAAVNAPSLPVRSPASIRSTAQPVSSGVISVIAMIPRFSTVSRATAPRCRASSDAMNRSGLLGGGASVMALAAR